MICTKHTLSPLSLPLSLPLTLTQAKHNQMDSGRRNREKQQQKWCKNARPRDQVAFLCQEAGWLCEISLPSQHCHLLSTCWTGTIQACYFCSLSQHSMKWWHTNHSPTQRQILQQCECIIWQSFPVVLWFEAFCTPIPFSHSSLSPGLPKPNEVIKRSPQGIIHFPNIT